MGRDNIYEMIKNMPTMTLRLGFALSLLVVPAVNRAGGAEASPSHFLKNVEPFLAEHCVACHSGDDAEGGVALDRYVDSANVQEDYELWEKIIRLVKEHQMPPPDEPQPSSEEIVAVSAALEVELSSFDCTSEKHPGRVTIRRLNKAEYDNTIRDLTGLELRLADDFPSDDVGAGFDNIPQDGTGEIQYTRGSVDLLTLFASFASGGGSSDDTSTDDPVLDDLEALDDPLETVE